MYDVHNSKTSSPSTFLGDVHRVHWLIIDRPSVFRRAPWNPPCLCRSWWNRSWAFEFWFVSVACDHQFKYVISYHTWSSKTLLGVLWTTQSRFLDWSYPVSTRNKLPSCASFALKARSKNPLLCTFLTHVIPLVGDLVPYHFCNLGWRCWQTPSLFDLE